MRGFGEAGLCLCLVWAAGVAPAAASDGAVILVGGAVSPQGIDSAAAATVAKRLGIRSEHEAAGDASEALAAFEAGSASYWDQGRLEAALAGLRRGRDALPAKVSAEDRPRAGKGLFLLAQLLLQEGRAPDEAAAALDLALQVDPEANLSAEEYPPKMVAVFQERRDAYRKLARTITLKMKDAPEGCHAFVDGVERGPLFRTLGPFLPGTHSVSVRCAPSSSWARDVVLDETDVDVEIPAHELELTADGGLLRLRTATHLDSLAERLVEHGGLGWVLAVHEAGAGGSVLALSRADAAAWIRSDPMPPSAAPAWLGSQLAAPAGEGPALPRSSRWWHFAMVGAGVAIAAGGAGANVAWASKVDETNAGDVDRRDEAAGLAAATWSLYGVGGALAISGLVLAIIGAPDEAPAAGVLPGPGGVSVVAPF